jgi:hypothetical protein
MNSGDIETDPTWIETKFLGTDLKSKEVLSKPKIQMIY